MGKRRDTIIDIMKGILILLMVLAHAQGSGHRWIYLFHMAVFYDFRVSFFWSLWNQYYKVYKTKGNVTFIPYIVCNILYLVWFFFTPIFFVSEVCERTVSGVINKFIKIFLFRGRSSMSEPTWFLAVPFIVSILYAVIRIVIGKIVQSDKNRYLLVTLSAMVSLAVGYIFYKLNFKFFQIGTICSAYVAFCLGNIVRKTVANNKIEQNKYLHMGLATLGAVGHSYFLEYPILR